MTSGNGRAWMGITAYGDKWSVQQGDAIRFHVNCDGPSTYNAQLVKLIHGDTNPAGPGFKEVPIDRRSTAPMTVASRSSTAVRTWSSPIAVRCGWTASRCSAGSGRRCRRNPTATGSRGRRG